MQAFIAHFQTSGSPHNQNIPVDWKQKDGPIQATPITQQPSHGTNNAGQDADMAAPPDPLLEVPEVTTSIESANMSFIDTPAFDDESLQGSTALDAPIRGHPGMSHVAWSKSDMKKQC